ncbi:MAG: hypothetical protein R3C44_15425 [Chloroflexota bacterium]
MAQKMNGESEEKKPDYVVDLEAAYGPPSEEGFGSAVFLETVSKDGDLEGLARKYYEHFVGDKWQEWGEETWMAPWKEVYARKAGTKHNVVKELKGIDDDSAAISIPMFLEGNENADAAVEALAAAYDDPAVTDFRVYTIGDGEAMSGVLLAGERENGEATFLVFLMD